MKTIIPSVNFHLWEPCNMRCKFCFAKFQDVKQTILPKGHLPRELAIEVVKQFAALGFKKITFAGGEPTLCPWLHELIAVAKNAGMTTMIVTNGTNLTDEFLQKNKDKLDWIAISIDSLNVATNISTGRAISGKTPLQLENYISLVDLIKRYGYGLKINTVVSSKNCNENMNEFIQYAKPKRWKIFQVLPIKEQNDLQIDEFKISENQFQKFIDNHTGLQNFTTVVPESNNQMKGSYAMVDPAGRFYDNANGIHNYSKPILEVGAATAIQQVNYDFEKFTSRGGIYDWVKPVKTPQKITISGGVASGKSTIGKLLAQKLNYEFTSIGNKTRAIANQKGLTIMEFQKQCLVNPLIDLAIDKEFSKECNVLKSLVIDYRLGFKFITGSYHIFLRISESTALERLKNANRENETHITLRERNAAFKVQFQNAYNIEYTNENNYDLIIDVEDFDSPEAIVGFILTKLI